jgi:hypothetical protein
MQEIKNIASLDGLRDRVDPLAKKLISTEDVQHQGAMKRMKVGSSNFLVAIDSSSPCALSAA